MKESSNTSREALDPAYIFEIGGAYWKSKVLLTAVGMRLFSRLAGLEMTADALGALLGLHPRGRRDFFDTLAALGFLDRTGDSADAVYRNSPLSAQFLDAAGPAYIGGILEMWEARSYRFWGDLGEGLRTGRAQNEIKHHERPIFEVLYEDPARLEQFVNAMAGISHGNFRAFVEKFDFSGYRTLCDVGGASGQLSILAAQRHPHLKSVSFDLPPVEPIARQNIERAGLADRIEVVSGNFFERSLPPADVVTMGMILHDWDLEKKKQLVRRAYEALPEGGAFVAIENLIDDARRENVFGLLMSLNMLIEFGDAFDFTGADFWSWCREAGFRSYEVIPLGGPCSAAVAYK